jgi:hypothetical protein
MYIGIRLLSFTADSNPQLAVFLRPIIYLYIAFAISTWIITPLSDLFLRLNVYGRYALTPEKIKASNYVGISFLIGITGGIAYLVKDDLLFLMILIYGISMMIPLASMLRPKKQKSKRILIALTILLGVTGLYSILQYFFIGGDIQIFTYYTFGVIGYQWISNAYAG